MDGPEKVKRRTRDGCWTCRKRKKKCDSPRIPCGNCTRLGLECENQVRLVWEDDARRAGMKRRGPTGRSRNGYAKKRQDGFIAYQPQSDSKQVEAQDTAPSEPEARDSLHDLLSTSEQRPPPGQIIRYQQLSPYPRVLDSIDSLLLDNYVQRFSRQYPTCSGPSNPFLSVLIPLAMKCGMVLDSVLALSGAQKWEHGIASMEKGSLRLRQRALAGTRALLFAENDTGNGGRPNWGLARHRSALAKNNITGSSSQPSSKREENLLYILTSSILFLLYEKVSGEPTWKPHMNFISQFFERWLTSLAIDAKQSSEVAEAVRFLHDIFVYNDLVRSTSLKTKPLSNFYLIATTANGTNCSPLEAAFFPSGAKEQADFRRRYYFPNLIARLSSGDLTVTEEAIAAWDGSMDWLPSFALNRSSSDETDSNTGSPIRKIPWDDRSIISELYRTAASIYRRRILISRSSKQVHYASELSDTDQVLPQLASFAHFLMMSLSEESAYENALLWPLGITAKELTLNQVDERRNVILRLQRLESRFQMRHFQSVQDVLLRHWAQRDSGLDPSERPSEEDAILLG